MKEKILQTLRELGFVPEKVEDLGYGFDYEGHKYLYMYNDEDENFLCFTVSNIMKITERNSSLAETLINSINLRRKYIKACRFGENVLFSYERELSGGEDLRLVVGSMILHLNRALSVAKLSLDGLDESLDHEDKDDNDDDDDLDDIDAEGNDYNE